MSFSVSFPQDTNCDDMADIFDKQIAAYPDSPGKDEANAVREQLFELFDTLTVGHETILSGNCYGSVSSSNASLGISLSFPVKAES